jgi:small nuclear ribonucleoprotein (snRNP)-like protein
VDFHNNVPENTMILKVLATENVKAKLKIYDVAANLILSETVNCEEGIDCKIYINAKNLSSGVYFGILTAKGEKLKLNFAIEK